MNWDIDWTNAAENVFEALKIKNGDRLGVIHDKGPDGREKLTDAITALAKKRGIASLRVPVTLDEKFDPAAFEVQLAPFLSGTEKEQRKFFFTCARQHYGPSRRAVHRITSVSPDKFCGYTISLATSDPEVIFDLANTSPKSLYKRGNDLKNILSMSTRIRITSKKGTDLSFDWDPDRRKYLISAGYPDTHEDRWDNLGGEVYTAPLHDTVQGRLVIDGAVGNMGLVKGTIVVDVRDGAGTLNRKDSTAPREQLEEFDAELNIFPCAKIVGEFGIGTTPGLKLRGELLNDEKVEGTIHIAFGDSYSSDGSGGENDCDAHNDCMILEPTVEMTIGGRPSLLMKDGKFLV